MSFLYYQEIPSVVALLFKIVLLGYAMRSFAQSHLARIFLMLLILFSTLNIVELGGMHYYYPGGLSPTVEKFGYAYFAIFIPVIAVILHLSLALSLDGDQARFKSLYCLLYVPVLPLEYLLLASNQLVAGFEPFRDSIQRTRGPLYFLFETYALVYLTASFANLIYGARGSRPSAVARARNRLWLIALLPIVFIFVYLITASALGWPKFTTTFYLPIGITFFLCVTTYAIHEHRLFDLEFYIPWSKVRKRKTAFYDRIRAMIAEIADLRSVNDAVDRLADTLRCPVALIGGPKPVCAAASGTMAAMPLDSLRGMDHIIVAAEIADRLPQVHTLMKQHGVAAVVPFYPHSTSAASWLLLGDSFSDQVYSRLDFRMVERLFDRMADLFLDKLIAMRAQLADAHAQIHTLQFRLQSAERNSAALQERLDVLSRENVRLASEQPADSLLMQTEPAPDVSITLLGRDKSMLKRLRERFPQTEQFASPDSSSFRRRAMPAVLWCDVEADATATERKLLELLDGPARQCAVLLGGVGAARFAYQYRKQLLGMLIEVLAPGTRPEATMRKVEALIKLRESLATTVDTEFPLAGRSAVYREFTAEAVRIAGFGDPVCIQSPDVDEAITVASYMHTRSQSAGEFRVLRAAKLARAEAGEVSRDTSEIDAVAHGGTLMIDNLGALSNEAWDLLLTRTNEFENIRLMAACTPAAAAPATLFKPLRPLLLRVPTLRERREDMPLLVHYYTLQFNLQAGTYAYLSQADVDDLMATNYPEQLATLKAAVFDRLRAKNAGAPAVEAPEIALVDSGKSLDAYVAEFEKRLIEQTLAGCDGNKSKAARVLGMRPNTLHYKLERYGLSAGKK